MTTTMIVLIQKRRIIQVSMTTTMIVLIQKKQIIQVLLRLIVATTTHTKSRFSNPNRNGVVSVPNVA